MADGVDSAAAAFQQAINPAETLAPRDESGRFAAVKERPEPLFSVRMVEGDPETGDTRDGGEDGRLASREREIADGRYDPRTHAEAEPQSRKAPAEVEGKDRQRRVPSPGEERDDATADDGYEGAENESDDEEADAAGDEEGEDEDEGPRYEVTVDGEHHRVTFNEMRHGYIREATFHSRMNKATEYKAAVDQESARVGQLRDIFVVGLQKLDEEIRHMLPPEPDWDKEYEVNPLDARRRQKSYQDIYTKLNNFRAQKAWSIEQARQDYDRRSAEFANQQFTEFVQDHKDLIKDESSMRRVLGGMRKMLLAENFAEHEVSGVYDKRMLNVVLKAYLYDRGAAVRPQVQAVASGPGRALIPGSATPIGNAGRRQVDEAQRRQARTGSIADTAAVFERYLR